MSNKWFDIFNFGSIAVRASFGSHKYPFYLNRRGFLSGSGGKLLATDYYSSIPFARFVVRFREEV